jgi:hypothetical protein
MRGTAEIELLLAIAVFLALLFLVRGSLQLGLTRLRGMQTSDTEAFQDATESNPPAYGQDVAIPDSGGSAALFAGLPNRLHMPTVDKTVTVTVGGTALPAVTLHRTAEVGSPAWTFAGYPDTGDQGATETWFSGFADTARGPLTYPLGLSASWPP